MIASVATAGVPARVLIIKPSALGDVVTAIPVLRGLRRSFGANLHVAWLLGDSYVDLLAGDGDLSEIIPFHRRRLGRAWRSVSAGRELLDLLRRLRRSRFDWVIDLQGLCRSGMLAAATGADVRAGFADAREGAGLFYTHSVRPPQPHTIDRNIALARNIGIDARREDLTLSVTPAAETFAARTIQEHGLGGGGFLVAVPPTRWPTKRYPVRHWRSVLSALTRQQPVVVLGSPGDQATGRAVTEGIDGAIDLTGQTGIAEMVGLIARCSAVICCDSAAKFIAPAVGVPAVTLIGPTRVELTGPYRLGSAIVADVPCQGCLKRRCPHVTCMNLIPPARVVAAVGEILASTGDADAPAVRHPEG